MELNKFIKKRNVLILYALGSIVLLVMGILDKCIEGPDLFPFWDASVVYGTVGAVFIAIILPIIDEEESKDTHGKNLISSVFNEILVNFDRLKESGIVHGDFYINIEQYERLKSKHYSNINVNATSSLRSLEAFYHSAKLFNDRMSGYIKKYFSWERLDSSEQSEKYRMSNYISLDVIKHMLLIFQIASIDTEIGNTMKAISRFVDSDTFSGKTLEKDLSKIKFWNAESQRIRIKVLDEEFEGDLLHLLDHIGGEGNLVQMKNWVLEYLMKYIAKKFLDKENQIKKHVVIALESLIK